MNAKFIIKRRIHSTAAARFLKAVIVIVINAKEKQLTLETKSTKID